jgi:hypothetical protein
MLSFLPRRWLQRALYNNWRRSLPRGDRIRLDYWGTTGNPEHHPFAWADELPTPTGL